ncbi:MAG: sugar phosphate nucleotidyltransferase [Vicinamibacterales bacterium]
MLLTAGLGTRLAPLSGISAKPALPVAGVPLAGRILRWLAGGGVTDAVLNLHHRPASITAAIGDGGAFGVRVRYVWEPRILGSAGGPARALPMLDANRFFLVNGDTLTDLDLAALAAGHTSSGAAVTLAVVPNPNPRHYGGVSVDGDGRVTGFTEPGPDNQGWHFIGVQAVERSVFARLDPDEPANTVSGIYRDLLARQPGAVRAMTSAAAFFDIGTAADYLETCLAIGHSEGLGDVLAGARTEVHARARVTRSVLWDDVVVAEGAALDECVVACGVRVPAGLRLSRRVVVPRGDRAPGAGAELAGDCLVTPLDAQRRRAT